MPDVVSCAGEIFSRTGHLLVGDIVVIPEGKNPSSS